MTRVIADASILIHLSRIGRFHLLKMIYGKIRIASGVFIEVAEKGWGLAGSLEVETSVRDGWIKVSDVGNRLKAREIAATRGVHLANAETVQLALESRATTLLADEQEVRELANEFGIGATGCLGILVQAARRKLITTKEAEADAERLVKEGYRTSEAVLREFHDLLSAEDAA